MKKITIGYSVEREDKEIFDGFFEVSLTKGEIEKTIEFIRDGHMTGELVDVPCHVYDKICEAMFEEAVQDLEKEGLDGLYETDGLYLQKYIPSGLLEELPDDIVKIVVDNMI